jgi:hypothetical protein
MSTQPLARSLCSAGTPTARHFWQKTLELAAITFAAAAAEALPPMINDYLSICGWCQTEHIRFILHSACLSDARPHYFSTRSLSRPAAAAAVGSATKLITICAQINNQPEITLFAPSQRLV